METVIRGKAWVGGDEIDSYQIIPMERWTHDALDPAVLGAWALEGADDAFQNKPWALRNSGATIIVAGSNYGGGGKSIEHPIIAEIGAGIRVVLAESFARYNYRNSVNNGLPVFVCKGLKEIVQTGDELLVDMVGGFVQVERTGERRDLVPFTPEVIGIMEAGGLIPYTIKRLQTQ